MNVDNLLRETLASYADQAPNNAGLTVAARDRADERRRNRHLATAGMAVVAAAGVGLVGWAVWPETAVQPVTPAEPSVLVEPTFELPAFPFTPGWAPPGAAEPYATLDGPILVLTHPHQDGGPPPVEVFVQPPGLDILPSQLGMAGGYYPVEDQTLRGYPLGSFVTTGGYAVAWRDEEGTLVVVNTERELSHHDLVQYAEELIEQPLPVTSPFTFDLLPAGAEPVVMRRDTVSFALQAGDLGARSGELTVALRDVDQSDARLYGNAAFWGEHHRERIQVGDHAAEYREGVGARSLRVFLPEDLVLDVYTSGVPALSRDDLVRFAAGVRLTPHAVPAR
jgi:hypothetical protein